MNLTKKITEDEQKRNFLKEIKLDNVSKVGIEFELIENIIDLKGILQEEKAQRIDAEAKAKAIAIKNFKLQEENEAMRNGRITTTCKVCKTQFNTLTEMAHHFHTIHGIVKPSQTPELQGAGVSIDPLPPSF
jgi:hypothetical protein